MQRDDTWGHCALGIQGGQRAEVIGGYHVVVNSGSIPFAQDEFHRVQGHPINELISNVIIQVRRYGWHLFLLCRYCSRDEHPL